MAKRSITREFLAFLREGKEWWLIPLALILLLLGCLVFFANSTALAPLLYPKV